METSCVACASLFETVQAGRWSPWSSKSIKRGFLKHFLCPEDLLPLGCFTAHETNQAHKNSMKRICQTIQGIQKKKKKVPALISIA